MNVKGLVVADPVGTPEPTTTRPSHQALTATSADRLLSTTTAADEEDDPAASEEEQRQCQQPTDGRTRVRQLARRGRGGRTARDIAGVEGEVLPVARLELRRAGATARRVRGGVRAVVACRVDRGDRVARVGARQVLQREAHLVRAVRQIGE